ncbi:MAG TPA: ABC transporter ATP-binding protein [Vicinamibacterales bacterium]|nr:ABC transporter ATP-binding protein [Vicinamibacterales bacterium]
MPELSARQLSKRYSGLHVVHNVNVTVRPGEVVGYLGPNGSGKTTTARMLAGLLEPSNGTVEYDGRDIREDLLEFRKRLGYIPEEPYLYPFLSGREYLELVGRLREMPEPLLAAKIDGFLRLFNLSGAADQSIASYSKGMRQKIVISAALLHDPEVVIFDEPETGLDVNTTMMLRHLVRTLAARGKAILYSSHILEIVEKVCDRILVLQKGRVVADDSIDALRTLLSSTTLEGVFAQLVIRDDPEQLAKDLADLSARRE